MPKSPGRPKKDRGSISPDIIVDTVKTLTLESRRIPSIRLLARHLDVDPMSIYHYFPSKQILLETVAASILESVYQPAPAVDWQRELEKLAISYVDTLRNFPGLLETLLSAPMLEPVRMFSTRFDTALESATLDKKTRRDALYLYVDYLHGFAYSATCWEEGAVELKTRQLIRPLRLLFQGMQA